MMAECPLVTRPAVREDLRSNLHDRIAREGPITFARFMEAALYDPERGFYSTHRVGRAGEFLTGPHLSGVFGRLVARQVEEFRRTLGDPDPFRVVELGAGDGTLARQILEALDDGSRAAVRYLGVERGPRVREILASVRGVEALAEIDDVPPSPAGCVVANELLDNLAFHRVVGTAAGPRELYVDVDAERFVLVEGEPSSAEIAAGGRDLPPGREGIVPVQAWRLLERAAGLFQRGFLWLCDYGSAGSGWGDAPSVHGYRAHRIEDDVLADPGSRDITGGVDFASVAGHAAGIGLDVWGPVSQRSALLALGFRKIDAEARDLQAQLLNAGRGADAMRVCSQRHAAGLLVARPGMGDFLVLCLGKAVAEPPPSIAAAMRLDDEGSAI